VIYLENGRKTMVPPSPSRNGSRKLGAYSVKLENGMAESERWLGGNLDKLILK
jgi:hypothetical protein